MYVVSDHAVCVLDLHDWPLEAMLNRDGLPVTVPAAECHSIAACVTMSWHSAGHICLFSNASQSSSRLLRGTRPPASLQLLWTWSCSLTEGLPVTSIAWNSANTNLVAAGYRSNPAADSGEQDAVDEEAAVGSKPGSAGSAARPGTGSVGAKDSKGGTAGVGATGGNGAAVDAAAGAAAEVAGAARGRVAVWSLKNQLHPVWTFETRSGEQMDIVV